MVIIGLFVGFGIAGVLIFAGIVPLFEEEVFRPQNVFMWGFLQNSTMQATFNDYNSGRDLRLTVKYTQTNPKTFDTRLIEAIANGSQPDLVLLPHDYVMRHGTKMNPIGFHRVTEQSFKQQFIEAGEIFMTGTGIIGMPMVVDPMVLYWNRDIFQNEGVVRPPAYWDELIPLAPLLTVRDNAAVISRSAIALGGYSNITHAKDIISILLMQAGSPMVRLRFGKFIADFDKTVLGGETDPSIAAFGFYTEFVNPAKPVYSWNASLPNDKDMFISGDLAMYLGFASEIPEITGKNPHLNFDISLLPQSRENPRIQTYGRVYGISTMKMSLSPNTSKWTAEIMTGPQYLATLVDKIPVAPARRDMLSVQQVEAHKATIYQSALVSRGWRDPHPVRTGDIFKSTVEDITAGRKDLNEATGRFQGKINEIFDELYGVQGGGVQIPTTPQMKRPGFSF